MDEYKRAIEAVVSPIEASERRKNTLWRELWSHFPSVFDELRVTAADAEAAQEALSRLGTAEAIRAAFYACVQKVERIGYAYDRNVRRGMHERMLSFVLRYVATTMIAMGAVCAFIVTCLFFLANDLPAVREYLALVLTGTLTMFISVWMFPVLILADRLEVRLRNATLERQSVREAVRLAVYFGSTGIVVGILAFGCGYSTLVALTGPDNSNVAEYMLLSPALIAFLRLQFVTVMPYAFAQHAQPISDWPYMASSDSGNHE